MRALASLLLLLLASQALAAECLGYSPIELRGVLRSETFPGPPNYESVATGDKAETYFFVVPAEPLCVRQGDTSGLEPAATGVRRVQLIFFDLSAYDKLRPFLGKEVRCTGKLIGAHTGHHHSEVLLTNSECNAAQPIIPPDLSRQAAPVR
jgi:hypothetical protein